MRSSDNGPENGGAGNSGACPFPPSLLLMRPAHTACGAVPRLPGPRGDALLRNFGYFDIVRAPRKVARDDGQGKGFQRGARWVMGVAAGRERGKEGVGLIAYFAAFRTPSSYVETFGRFFDTVTSFDAAEYLQHHVVESSPFVLGMTLPCSATHEARNGWVYLAVSSCSGGSSWF